MDKDREPLLYEEYEIIDEDFDDGFGLEDVEDLFSYWNDEEDES